METHIINGQQGFKIGCRPIRYDDCVCTITQSLTNRRKRLAKPGERCPKCAGCKKLLEIFWIAKVLCSPDVDPDHGRRTVTNQRSPAWLHDLEKFIVNKQAIWIQSGEFI